MNPFEKILERLEEYEYNNLIEHNSEQCEHCKSIDCGIGMDCSICIMDKAKEIVKEVAEEYNGGWISCSEMLPKECVDVLVWFEYFRYGSFNRLYQTIGISYTYNGDWSGFVNGSSGWRDLRIIAWQPIPEPYQKNGE